jgi:hypothetical protein
MIKICVMEAVPRDSESSGRNLGKSNQVDRNRQSSARFEGSTSQCKTPETQHLKHSPHQFGQSLLQ